MHRPDTLFIGRNFLELPAVNSTNEYALTLLSKSKPPEGTVISTPNQYAGRGQIGSGWESTPGKNIAVSIILYPTFLPPNRQFILNQTISLAVSDLLGKYFTGAVKVKWPNDIYIHDKKAVGILIQNAISGTHMRSSIIGIGINVNQEKFSPEISNPTSFKLETGIENNISLLIAELCHFLENRYLKLKSGKLVPLQEDYLQRLYRYNEESHFQRQDGSVFKGTIIGISEIGELKIERRGTIESFGLKEIKFL